MHRKPELRKPELRKPEIRKPELRKPELRKPELRKPELRKPGAKTIKKNTNSTRIKYQTHRAKQYEVTSFLSTDCELSTETCSKNVYSLGPRAQEIRAQETHFANSNLFRMSRHQQRTLRGTKKGMQRRSSKGIY